jgi:hypothetical protein
MHVRVLIHLIPRSLPLALAHCQATAATAATTGRNLIMNYK